MLLDHSWDEESEEEYLNWIRSSKPTFADKKACAELWAIMKEEILKEGPKGYTQCENVQRADGATVALYCVIRMVDIAMCFAYDGKHVRLVLMGPHNSPDIWDIATERTKRW